MNMKNKKNGIIVTAIVVIILGIIVSLFVPGVRLLLGIDEVADTTKTTETLETTETLKIVDTIIDTLKVTDTTDTLKVTDTLKITDTTTQTHYDNIQLDSLIDKFNSSCDNIINNSSYDSAADIKRNAIYYKELVNKKQLPLSNNELSKFKRVKSIQINTYGIYVYDFFKCNFSVKENEIYFVKTGGSQRKSGYLFRKDDNIFYFSGGWNNPYAGTKSEGYNISGLLYKIAKDRLIMIFNMEDEDDIEIYEIIK